jgi:undecaprenyl-diphosphatase
MSERYPIRTSLVALLGTAVVTGVLLLVLPALGIAVMDMVLAIDRQVYLAIRGGGPEPPGPEKLVEVVRDLSALGGVAITGGVALVAVAALYLGGLRREALFLVATILTGVVAAWLLKEIIARPRPDLHEPFLHVTEHSFPSGHASRSALVFLGVATVIAGMVRLRSLRVFAVLMAVALMLAAGISRVYLGAHWPTDVLAGWLFGSVWVLGARLLFLRYAGDEQAAVGGWSIVDR